MKTFMQATLSVIVMLSMTPWPKLTSVSVFAGANNGAARDSSMAIHINEIIDLDTYDPGGDAIVGPVVSATTLLENQEYSLTISGTFSYWFPNWWFAICKNSIPEGLPQNPSPNIQNGKAGADPQYIFAAPNGWTGCQNSGQFPISFAPIEVSTNNGITWSRPTPINSAYPSPMSLTPPSIPSGPLSIPATMPPKVWRRAPAIYA